MYISHIRLENIRGFRELEIDFSGKDGSPRKRTVIIGKNGTCKTSVLRAIALGLCDLTDATTLISEPIGEMHRHRFGEGAVEILLDDGTELGTLIHSGTDGKELLAKEWVQAYPRRCDVPERDANPPGPLPGALGDGDVPQGLVDSPWPVAEYRRRCQFHGAVANVTGPMQTPPGTCRRPWRSATGTGAMPGALAEGKVTLRSCSLPALPQANASPGWSVEGPGDTMKRIWTIIGVRDVPGSFKWYQSLLGQPETRPAHDHFGQILDTDGTVLLCLHQWGAHEHPTLTSPDTAPPGNGLLLFFRVDDFDRVLERARALATRFEEEPHMNPNTRTLEFSLRDPDGYYVTVSAL